jgi:3-oxoacyl-[acyl-carrier-protein] synthase-1
LTNPTETRFIGSGGDWIMGHEVGLQQPWRGLARLASMAALAIEECLSGVPREQWRHIPLILCVAERERPGRTAGLEGELLATIQQELGAGFSERSILVPHGRASLGTALISARNLFVASGCSHVLIAATDSLLTGPTLASYDAAARLLNSTNPNGFLPGEGAGAVLLTSHGGERRLYFDGVGLGVETARVDLELPLRADGLTQAIQDALQDAGCELDELDFRITDTSGEQYYFKEAALALARCLRRRKEQFDLWHPGDCIGETGALAGVAGLVVAEAACRKRYAPGPNLLLHLSSDAGQRAASIWHFEDSGRGE